MSEQRFFIDERSGIIAVRDRTLTDPDYNGLHPDTEGVVWSRMGLASSVKCSHCQQHMYTAFTIPQADREEALRVCNEMNARPAEADAFHFA